MQKSTAFQWLAATVRAAPPIQGVGSQPCVTTLAQWRRGMQTLKECKAIHKGWEASHVPSACSLLHGREWPLPHTLGVVQKEPRGHPTLMHARLACQGKCGVGVEHISPFLDPKLRLANPRRVCKLVKINIELRFKLHSAMHKSTRFPSIV